MHSCFRCCGQSSLANICMCFKGKFFDSTSLSCQSSDLYDQKNISVTNADVLNPAIIQESNSVIHINNTVDRKSGTTKRKRKDIKYFSTQPKIISDPSFIPASGNAIVVLVIVYILLAIFMLRY